MQMRNTKEYSEGRMRLISASTTINMEFFLNHNFDSNIKVFPLVVMTVAMMFNTNVLFMMYLYWPIALENHIDKMESIAARLPSSPTGLKLVLVSPSRLK